MKKLSFILTLAILPLAVSGVTVPGSSFPITNNPPSWATFLMVDTNGQASANPNTRSNLQLRFDEAESLFGSAPSNYTASVSNTLGNAIAASGSGFVFLITNGSSAAVIKSVFDSMTSGGTVNIQPGSYIITNAITITNSMIIEGNGASFVYTLGLTNYMLDTGTNYGKPLVIQDLTVVGGCNAPFQGSGYFFGANDYRPYTTQLWTNRTGMRLEASGGLVVRGCKFVGWSGNGLLLLNRLNQFATSSPRAFVINNQFATNFIGCCVPAANYDIPGYYNSGASEWNNLPSEYSQIIDNQAWANQIGIMASAGNLQVLGNIVNSNYTGLLLTGGQNNTHGQYSYNNLNHNPFPIFLSGGDAIVSAVIIGNKMLQCGSVIFRGTISAFTFQQNELQTTTIVCTNNVIGGSVSGNLWQGTVPWTSIYNYTLNDSRVRVYGNIALETDDNDGSLFSVRGGFALLTNNWPPTFSSLGAVNTNQVWQAPSNSVPPNWWFGHFDASSNVVFDGHMP